MLQTSRQSSFIGMSQLGHFQTSAASQPGPFIPQQQTYGDCIDMSVLCQVQDSCTAAKRCHSITSSARAITESGTVMPSDLAVLRLMLRWKRVGCSNGRSAGLAPFKMRSIKEVARS